MIIRDLMKIGGTAGGRRLLPIVLSGKWEGCLWEQFMGKEVGDWKSWEGNWKGNRVGRSCKS